jgi:hypothetical protein
VSEIFLAAVGGGAGGDSIVEEYSNIGAYLYLLVSSPFLKSPKPAIAIPRIC